MHVGITYDLRIDYERQGYSDEATAEFEGIETIEAIDSALSGMGHSTDRIGNVQNLTARLAAGQRWDLVFNIAEGLHGYGREAQVPALLDAFCIPYTFSDPLVLAIALHKPTAKQLVRSMGLPTPDFTILNDESELNSVNLSWPVFVKPVAGGSSAGISGASIARDRAELAKVSRDLISRFHQPVLVESFLPGREFTVGIVGTGERARSYGVMEIFLLPDAEPAVYSFTNKRNYETRVSYQMCQDDVAARAEQIALRAWTGLGGRDAGRVDIRCDADGEPNFLEVNPLAGLHPIDSDLKMLGRLQGKSHSELIENIVASACERIPGRTLKSAGAA